MDVFFYAYTTLLTSHLKAWFLILGLVINVLITPNYYLVPLNKKHGKYTGGYFEIIEGRKGADL